MSSQKFMSAAHRMGGGDITSVLEEKGITVVSFRPIKASWLLCSMWTDTRMKILHTFCYKHCQLINNIINFIKQTHCVQFAISCQLYVFMFLPSVLWCCWLGGRKGIRLERGADLHMAQLMPLPLTVSCFSKIQTGFTFLVLAHTGSPGQSAVKRMYVCKQLRRKVEKWTDAEGEYVKNDSMCNIIYYFFYSRVAIWVGVKLKDRLPSKELRERLGVDDSIGIAA